MGDFHKQKNQDYMMRLRTILKELPAFCGYYFRATETTNSVLTRYGYAVDLRSFFQFCIDHEEVRCCNGLENIRSMTLSHLNQIGALDIELYLEHVSMYDRNGKLCTNKERAKARKLSALRSFFKYYHRQGMIENNVCSLVDAPKVHEKAIIRLEVNEVADLIDNVEDGNGLTAHQRNFHNITKLRDAAIITLFLGTGIRISELVGLDIRDMDFERDAFIITRKGGNQDTLSLSDEVRSALLAYLEERNQITPLAGHENALFLSIQKRRITVRAVENLVKKYAEITTPLKHISPHKLRSTYGTMLYRESGDIYLVADVLGHKDVNTTRKHYAAMSEDRKRQAAKLIRLRDEESSSIAKTRSNPDGQSDPSEDPHATV